MLDVNKIKKSKHFKYGAPFLTFMLLGSFGLREFASLRYIFNKVKPFDEQELERKGIKMKKYEEVTLETEYEKIKSVDIDSWENVRIPRPWDETPVDYNK